MPRVAVRPVVHAQRRDVVLLVGLHGDEARGRRQLAGQPLQRLGVAEEHLVLRLAVHQRLHDVELVAAPLDHVQVLLEGDQPVQDAARARAPDSSAPSCWRTTRLSTAR